MPMICEVCGNMEESAEWNAVSEQSEFLHVCANCVRERQQPGEPGTDDET